jgi:antitoxin component of MazEF toxin-antitoxin module
MSKTIQIGKWGNSLGVRIPQFIVDNLDLEAGDVAEITYRDDTILIELHKKPGPIKRKTPEEELDELILRQLREAGVPGY